MPRGIQIKRYTSKFKKQVAEAMLQDGLSYQEAAKIYEIHGHNFIQNWDVFARKKNLKFLPLSGAEVQINQRNCREYVRQFHFACKTIFVFPLSI